MSSLQKRLIFKKYRVGKLIEKTQISLIHEGVNETTEEPIAMKFEKIGGKFDYLGKEIYFLIFLKGIGIPNVISFGQVMNYKVLIEELLGKSIFKIWNKLYNKNRLNNNKQILFDICLIAIRCLDRLEFIHSKNIVHKDIKPANFLFGKKNPNLIYLIDFCMSRKYRSSKTGKHIKLQKLKKVNGTISYMSINSCKGYMYSRRDDLESLGYMLIFLTKNDLPWIFVEKEDISPKLKLEKVGSIKSLIKPEELCQGLPSEFSKYIDYCQKLEFEQDPDYNYLRNLFIDILKSQENLYGLNHLNCKIFSFFDKKDSNKLKEKILLIIRRSSQPKNIDKGKSNTYKRIYSHIKSPMKGNKGDASDLSNVACLNTDLKNISINNRKNEYDTYNNNKIKNNNMAINNDSKIINKIGINIFCSINNNNKKEIIDKKILEPRKAQSNNFITNISELNKKIFNNKLIGNYGQKPNKLANVPIQKNDIKCNIKTRNNYNLMKNNIPKKLISKNSANLTNKSKINYKLNKSQNNNNRNFSESIEDVKQNTLFHNNKNLIKDSSLNDKTKEKYNLNEKIPYKSIIKDERKKEKQNNQIYKVDKSFLNNNNYKNEFKCQNQNNFSFKNNTLSIRHYLSSINTSNARIDQSKQLYTLNTFGNDEF